MATILLARVIGDGNVMDNILLHKFLQLPILIKMLAKKSRMV